MFAAQSGHLAMAFQLEKYFIADARFLVDL